MSDTSHTEAPEEVPEVVEAPVSITKPKKVKKERTPAQKEAFAKAQAKRQETMKVLRFRLYFGDRFFRKITKY